MLKATKRAEMLEGQMVINEKSKYKYSNVK